jgi:hypothetical protein
VADILRTGLERATSCHDHDGFQASPLQFFEREQSTLMWLQHSDLNSFDSP